MKEEKRIRGQRRTKRGLDVHLKLAVAAEEWAAIQELARRDFRHSEYDWIREQLRPILLPVMRELAAKKPRDHGEVVKK